MYGKIIIATIICDKKAIERNLNISFCIFITSFTSNKEAIFNLIIASRDTKPNRIPIVDMNIISSPPSCIVSIRIICPIVDNSLPTLMVEKPVQDTADVATKIVSIRGMGSPVDEDIGKCSRIAEIIIITIAVITNRIGGYK